MIMEIKLCMNAYLLQIIGALYFAGALQQR